MTELAFLMIELQDTSGQCLESVVERFVNINISSEMFLTPATIRITLRKVS